MIELTENAKEVTLSRYIRNDNGIGDVDWEGCCKRVAKYIASIEKTEKEKGFWGEKFLDMLLNLKALPGGRTLRNAGTPSNTLLNCHVLRLDDSIKSIGEFLNKALVLNAEGGGVGCTPNLRPKGASIKIKGGNSSGLLSFLDIISYALNVVESGGNRRSGMLPIVPVSHPEIIDFINSKLDPTVMNNFNLSVGVTNEFLDCVEQKEKWKLTFGGKEYSEIWAVDLFDKIIENNLKSGEPGLVNIDNMKISNSWYFSPISSLNLCGELKLSAGQSCCLGSIVLPNFTYGGRTNWVELEDTIKTLVRFLDNVLDANSYSFEDMKESTMSCRRIGIGVTGLGDYLFDKKVRYGSPTGLDKTSGVIKFIRDTIYSSSIELAKERGSFPGYNKWAYLNSKFVKKLPTKIRLDIKECGIRNCTTMAFAPAGTISLVADTTSGVEPLPLKAYERRDRVGSRIYINPIYKEFVKNKEKIPNWMVDSLDLSPEEHFETTVAIQVLNDGGISKTQILPANTKAEQLKEWVLEYARKLVGITMYVDGSRKDQILNRLSEKELRDIIEKDIETEESLAAEDVACKNNSCDI